MCMFIPLLVTATLPADNGGASAYSVGDIFAGGTVLCVNSTGGNYTLPIEPEVEGAALIVFALQPADLFTQNMASANSSLDSFLSSDAVGAQAVGATSYLFLAYGRTDAEAAATTVAFRSRILDRIMATKNHTVDTLARMHFGAQRVPSIAGLNDVLAQWTTPINSISVQLPAGATLNISRLDGKYEVCDWPSEGQALPPLVDAGSGCKPLDPKVYEGKTAVVRSDGCSPETAVRNGGNIIVAAKGRLPTELSSGCRHGAFATVVSSGEGTLLFTALASAKGGLLNASLLSRRAPGAFVAIDAEGKLQEVGWEKYSTLEMLAWSAQYFDYLTRLRARLIRPHFSVPIRGWKGGRANVSIPPADLLRLFSTMEVENVLTCSDSEGRMDQSCPAWDHNIALGVACGASHQEAHAAIESQLRSAGQQDGQHGLSEPGGFEGELARYITPFRRRLGHWLTPATHMMPLLTQPSKRHCAFSLANPGWVNDFTLRFSGDAWGADGAPPAFTTNLFQGGNFGSTYNLNRTLLVPPPITINVTRKVELALILSGHGKMEFLPSTHTFSVNGVPFTASSEGVAGTAMGCAAHVREGRAQPNEHGTWYTGRNFCASSDGLDPSPSLLQYCMRYHQPARSALNFAGCNGADVPVHRFDVTAAAAMHAPVNITYHALGPGGGAPGKQGGGNIVLSSVLAWSV